MLALQTLMWYLDEELLDNSSFATVKLLQWSITTENRDLGTVNIPLAGAAEKPNVMITKKNQNLQNNSLQPTGASGIEEFTAKETDGAQVPAPTSTPMRDLSNRKQFFQVRVVIIECRQLQENNIKPVVKVSIGDYSFRTRIKRGNNPYYNETFIQNFNETPLRLFDQLITIQIEMGVVYDSPGHALVSKWLSLYDPVNLNAGFKGYVKVTLCVLGAGDRAPDMDQSAETGDVESNLLQLAGIPAARTATLQLYIYRAEDVPQTQDGTVTYFTAFPENPLSISVDPSLEVNFAGRLLRTKVISGDTNPVWNQVLCFPVQLPSICDLIKLTIMDGAEEGDGTVLGMAFISLSQISYIKAETKKDNSGFLPCFGPSFLTFYGNPKEFLNPAESLEKHRTEVLKTSAIYFMDTIPPYIFQEEGITYRGRALLELRTVMEAIPVQKIDDIPEETVKKMQHFLPQFRYGLCVVFYSATMLADTSKQIQFEVSLGNYGNKFDETCKPFASTTQCSHAVYDGNYYYYLPWYDTKPMVTIISFWEDVGYRIACTNTLQFIHERLKKNLDSLKTISLPHGPLVDAVWQKLQKELVEDCKKPLPALHNQKAVTVLDQQLWKLRIRVLQQISKAAEKTSWKSPLQKLIPKAEGWLNQLASITSETQISIPDVVIWMLWDDQRVAYARVKSQSIMFSKAGPYAKGRLCGKTHTIFLKDVQSKGNCNHIPAVLRVRMWMGRMADSADFMQCCEGRIAVYAETYENQKKTHGIWGTMDLMPHPNFSDVTGQVSLPKDKFQLPRGWQWDGEWAVEPQRRLLLDKETNYSEVLEEVYENQSREPGRRWKPATIPYSNVSGAPTPRKEEILCPPGWVFIEEWKVEVNRAVDDAGWEYGIAIPPAEFPCFWNAAEKTYHTHRRRRWLRKRFRNLGRETREDRMASFLRLHSEAKLKEDVWEYAPLHEWRFHLQRQPDDVFRRRCWRRKLAPAAPSHVAPIFFLEGSLGVDVGGRQKKKKTEAGKKDETEEVELEPPASQGLLKMNTALLFCVFKSPVYFQLRCYMYQARDLMGSTVKGTADPLAHVSFLHVSHCTHVINGTLHPCWNETLLFEDVLIYGDPRGTEQDPPIVAVEIFDNDSSGQFNDFMGRCTCTPNVCLDLDLRRVPRLQRYSITKKDEENGYLLAAFELLLDKKDGSLGKHPPPAWKDGIYTIPKGIQPILRLMAVEILAWGLRDMKNYNLMVVNNPSLIVECGGESIQTTTIRNFQEYPNFSINIYLMKVYLPVDEDYSPPIELKVIDHRDFGYKPVVGQATVRSLSQYYCNPLEEREIHTLPPRATGQLQIMVMEEAKRKEDFLQNNEDQAGTATKGVTLGTMRLILAYSRWQHLEEEEEDEEEIDWWSKYYVTMGDLSKSGHYLEKGFDSMKIYNCELEEVPEFQGFQDFCQTFWLYRGKVSDNDPLVGGELKGLFRIYPLPEDPKIPPPPRQFQELPSNVFQDCLVRVYIIRAFNLQPKDLNGLCDPYVKIKLGKDRVDDREEYIPNTVDPVFGRIYELTCTIPREKDLKISLYDFDLFSSDDIIGDTTVDLENRLLSHYGANCGLPQTYCVAGPTQWRDQLLPSELLENYSQGKNVPRTEISEDGGQAVFMGRIYQLSDFETEVPSHGFLGPAKERMALHLLRTCGLVPEHVETRTLYSSALPGIDQGKVQMWVDIFPLFLGDPGPPFDITPRKPKKYELRCIIWNTKDVDLEETNIFGDRMTDIYVKGWMDGLEEDKQRTDVHYRSLAGEGNFNWRFIFSLDYLPMEQVCVLTKKQHFWSLDETMQKVPPKLIIQIWDNDKFSADDFIGSLEMNLNSIPRPARRPRDCTLKLLQDDGSKARSSTPFRRHRKKCISLFTQRNMRGWWPCIVFENNKPRVSGKVEMTLELLTDQEAEELPAGKGREEPNANPILKPPERPETSFLWFTAPLKSLHFIIWQKSKWKILIFLCIVLVILLFAHFIYSAPGYLAMKLVNPMKVHGPSWFKQSSNNKINTILKTTWTTSEVMQTIPKSLPPAAPKKGPPAAPKKGPPAAPKKEPPAAPKKGSPAAPKKRPPAAPKKGPPAAPKKGPPAAPKKGSPAAPKKRPPAAPKKGPPAAPKKGPPAAPKKGPPAAPKKRPPAAPKKGPPAAPKKGPPAAPKKGPITAPKKGPITAPKKMSPQTPRKVPTTRKKVPQTTLKKVPPTTLKKVPRTLKKARSPCPISRAPIGSREGATQLEWEEGGGGTPRPKGWSNGAWPGPALPEDQPLPRFCDAVTLAAERACALARASPSRLELRRRRVRLLSRGLVGVGPGERAAAALGTCECCTPKNIFQGHSNVPLAASCGGWDPEASE
ncbi:myoferlin-like [Candoia aspera]|uniref:myoferlin-like n=1 Tax=Candoia aspera TaxID=51853 RepID=UPI002FD7D6B5